MRPNPLLFLALASLCLMQPAQAAPTALKPQTPTKAKLPHGKPVALAAVSPSLLSPRPSFTPLLELSGSLSRIKLPLNMPCYANELNDLSAFGANNQWEAEVPTSWFKPTSPLPAGQSLYQFKDPKRNLQSLSVEPLLADTIGAPVASPNPLTTPKMQIGWRLKVSYAAPSTASLRCENKPNPQLVLEVQEAYTQTQEAKNLGLGLDYSKLYTSLGAGSGNVALHVLAWQPKQSTFTLQPATPSGLLKGLAPVVQTAANVGAVAGVNASFFNSKLRIPMGAYVEGGELLASPILNRGSLGLLPDGTARLERLNLNAFALGPNGLKTPLQLVNQPRMSLSQTVLYTPLWGPESPIADENTLALLVHEGLLTEIKSNGSLPLQGDDWVIFGPKTTLAAWLDQLPRTEVQVQLGTTPDWSNMEHIVAGGPLLVKRGKVVMNLETEGFKSLPANERTSRTVVGITPEGVVKLIVVERPTGLSLPALANLMQGMGLSEALNLDGGSSSQMVVQGQVVYSAVIGGRGAPVSTSLVFTPKKTKP